MTQSIAETETGSASGRAGQRHAAGQDPEKRRQILAGASQVFTTMGFDAASMNDITRAAGVSKGTLYVYFADKEQLFLALLEQERDRHRQELFEAMEEDSDPRRALTEFGRRLVRLLTQDCVLRAQRVVLGVGERMPALSRSFFEAGALGTARRLAAYLDRQMAAGRLSMPDSLLAAAQFLELAQATLVRPRLYAALADVPSDEEIDRVVASAVGMFCAAYGREPTDFVT